MITAAGDIAVTADGSSGVAGVVFYTVHDTRGQCVTAVLSITSV